MSERSVLLVCWLAISMNLTWWVAFGSVLNLTVGLYLIGRLFELREVSK